MNRTAVGDLQQTSSLLIVERSVQFEPALDLVNTAFLSFAISAVRRMNLPVAEPYDNFFERPPLAIGVHPKCHRSACPERRDQVLVRVGPTVGATGADRFVGEELHAVRSRNLREVSRLAGRYSGHVTHFRLDLYRQGLRNSA